MCVILVGKIGKNLFKQAVKENPHGFSFYTKELGLKKAINIKEVEKELPKAVNQYGVWHFRIKSSGAIDKENIHPFKVARGQALLYHNGVLGNGKGTLSDTNAFAKLLYNSDIETVKSVLASTCTSQRFLLVDSEDPTIYRTYGDWKVDGGVLMSHKMYSSAQYSKLSYGQRAGWYSVNDYSKDKDKGFIVDDQYLLDGDIGDMQ